jgi:glycosyltransferase involved in cell wall biosynthesis
MRVIYDAQIFCHQRFGGVSRYFCCVANELARGGEVTPLIVAPIHFNEYLDQLPKSIVFGKRVRLLEHMAAISYALGALPSKVIAKRFRPDIVHNTYYLPIKPSVGTKAVVTVHDLIHEKFPENTSPSASLVARWKSRCIALADHVICVSENTRKDLLEHYKIDANKVSVCYHGSGVTAANTSLEPSTATGQGVSVDGKPYILFVGGRSGYKNFAGLLNAFASSHWLRNNFLLLCFGGGEFDKSEQRTLSGLGVSTCVKQLGGSDRILANCYAKASVFAFPSRYEGFGIPLLEAMSLNCPVACSDSSSFPEVVGSAAKMFNPDQPESIRSALEFVLGSPAESAKLIKLGQGRRQQFSWALSAESTAAAYRRVLG